MKFFVTVLMELENLFLDSVDNLVVEDNIMNKIIIPVLASILILGTIISGIVVFADDDDDELSELACEAGKAMTGILFEDDDEIIDVICEAQVEGPPGPVGASITYVNNEQISLASGQGVVGLAVFCDDGDIATGGGFNGLSFGMEVFTNEPIVTDSISPTGWRVSSQNTGNKDLTITAYVVCADITP